MAIPDFQTIILPLLKMAADKEEHSIREAVDYLAEHFSLTDEEINRLQPSGQGPKFYKRVGWARTYLKKAGLLEDPRRGYFQITERGKSAMAEKPQKINMKYLERYPEYIEFKEFTRQDDEEIETREHEELTPEEALENAYQRIRNELAEELLTQINSSTPAFFEKLVVDLIVSMG